MEWFYQLEGTNIRNWEDLAVAFYRQYQYNVDLALTRIQLQSMSMGSSEGFKDYSLKWRDLTGRVQPPLSDRELVDMFLGTLSEPFFNYLIGSSSAGFTELIMTGERVEAGIRSGKIQKDASSSAVKKPFVGKKEASAVYSSRNQNQPERLQVVNVVVISRPTVAPQCNNQHRMDRPQRQYTQLNMTLSQILP